MGSPRPAAQQILLRATVTCLFIHSLFLRFSSSLTGSSLCSLHPTRLHFCCPSSPRVFFCCCFCFSTSVSCSHPPSLSLWLSPPSPYPSPSSFLLCASLPLSLPTSHQAICSKAQIHRGGADSEGEPEIKGKMGGSEKERWLLHRKKGKKERMTDSLGKKAGGRG